MPGYDYDFVKCVRKKLCEKCDLPCKEMFFTTCCGHGYCKSCLEIPDDSDTKVLSYPCKTCGNESVTVQPNPDEDREITANLEIYCSKRKVNGCRWTGVITDINKHLSNPDGCEIECDKCKDIYFEFEKSAHDSQCPCYCSYCNTTAGKDIISRHHKSKCRHKPSVSCTKCGQFSNNLDYHIQKECQLEGIECEYHCESKVLRNDMAKHDRENTVKHIQFVYNKLHGADTEIQNDINVKVQNAKQKLEAEKDHINKQVEYLKSLIVTQKKLSALLWIAVVIIVLVLSHFRSQTLNKIELQAVELWPLILNHYSDMSSAGNQVAPVIMKMPNFTELLQKKLPYWNSSRFFTFERGHQMALKVYVTNYFTEIELKFTLYLIKGPYDNELDNLGFFPLKGTFFVQILNQLSDTDHYLFSITPNSISCPLCTNRVTKYYDVSPSGWPETEYVPKIFFLRDDNKYRKNDSVYFRILYQQNYKDIYKMGDLIKLIISCVSAAVAFIILPLLLLQMFQCTTCTVDLVKWICLVVSGIFVVQSVIGGIMWAMLSWITDWTFMI